MKRATTPTLPRDGWRHDTFIEANGTELEVVWNGRKDDASLCGEWEQRRDPEPPPLRLRTGRGGRA